MGIYAAGTPINHCKQVMMGAERGLLVRVMTDEQMEVLRRQISAYSVISEHLVEMHKAYVARLESLAGARVGNLYCDPLMTPWGQRLTARPRWSPMPAQLQILEAIFTLGNGTPSKPMITEITVELLKHGNITESNVYNWFQNKRARSKRKQKAGPVSNTDSEAAVEAESSTDRRANSQRGQPLRIEYISNQSPEITSGEEQLADPETNNTQQDINASNDSAMSSDNLVEMYFNDSAFANAGSDNWMSNLEVPGSITTS